MLVHRCLRMRDFTRDTLLTQAFIFHDFYRPVYVLVLTGFHVYLQCCQLDEEMAQVAKEARLSRENFMAMYEIDMNCPPSRFDCIT